MSRPVRRKASRGKARDSFCARPGLWTASEGWEDAHKIPWVDPEGGVAPLSDALTNVLLFVPWGVLLAAYLVGRGRGLR